VLYSYILKNIVIIDIFTIAAGFVLRAVAGAAVLDIAITPWLLLCMGLLALFLGLGKRRGELASSTKVPRPTAKSCKSTPSK
jgi:4-hydroxybenzoate polyprenyltransferase